jgi:subtilisin family serine protease
MKVFVTLVAFCLIAAQAKAEFIYQIHNPSMFRAMDLSTYQVVDSIPQLGIIVTARKIGSTRQSGISYLGENRLMRLPVTKSAPWQSLWGLKAIEAELAWTKSQGEGIIVAVSDTGVDAVHPDLAPNMWVNPNEIAGNGKDDDKNGYIDDVHGWNFGIKKPGGKDNHYHGTHVAGTIGSRIGTKLAGVAPKVRLLDASFITSQGTGTEINGAKTIVYAVDQGAKIINCSWGSTGKDSAAIVSAIAYAKKHGVLIVAAAGNNSADADVKHFTPAGVPSDNVLSVGASSSLAGGKASFSNYGKLSVDLSAPGQNILSASPSSGGNFTYRSLSGTSMASPHMAGIAALVWAANPELSYLEVKKTLMNTAVPSIYWSGKSITGAVGNAANALGL